jgi:hypothetical protein
MVHDVDIRQFLRRAPREWMKRYFRKLDVLGDFNWDSITIRNIEPLFDAWNALDEAIKVRMGEDFNHLHLLGTPVGKTAIIDEAQFHPVPDPSTVAPALAQLPDPLSCAFWTFLERPDLWNGAILFSVADLKPKRWWKKRLYLPKLGREPTRGDAGALAAAVSEVFMRREARGAHCVVYPYRRRNKEYYFTYPQDHRSTSNEYDDEGQWTKRPYNPAFEVIFIHDDAEQSLMIWHQAPVDRIKDLQVAFAEAVLGQKIERDVPRDDRVYDLERFLVPKPAFGPRPAPGISKVEVRKLSVRTLGRDQHTIRIELAPDTDVHVLYRRLEAATSGIDPTMLKVSGVGLQVTLEQGPNEPTARTRSFDLSWPNSCSLDSDEIGQRIQQMLVDHGIEPRQPTSAEDGDQAN